MNAFWAGFEKRANEAMGYASTDAAAPKPPVPPPPKPMDDTPDRPAAITGQY